MLVKEQAELEAKAPEHKSETTPDFLDQAKSALEKKLAGVSGGLLSLNKTIDLQHPTAQPVRVATVLHAQQTEGNYYVQRAIQQYRKSHLPAEDKPVEKETKQATAPAGSGIATASQSTGAAAPRASRIPTKGQQSGVATSARAVTPSLGGAAGKVGAHVGKAATKTGAHTGSAAAGVTTSTLEAWKEGFHSDTAKLPKDKISAAAQVGQIQQTGTAATNKQKTATKQVPKDAQKAVSPSPTVNTPPPVVPVNTDPVPEATQLIGAASDQAIPRQTMPALEESPQHHMPQLSGEPTPTEPAKTEESKAAPDAKAKDGDAGKNDPGKVHADKVNDAAAKKPDLLDHKGAGGEIVLEDKGGPAPAEPAIPPIFKASIAAVLARMLVDPKAEAHDMLKQVRTRAYNGQLQEQFPDIGDSLVDDLSTSLQTELDGIRKEAGIADQEITAAVAKRRQEIKTETEAANKDVKSAGDAEKKKLEEAGTDALGTIAGARETLDKATEDKLAAAKGDKDPEVLKFRRDRLIHEAEAKVARQVVHYDEAGKKRRAELQQVVQLEKVAYRNAAKQDEQQLVDAAKGDDDKLKSARLTAAASWNWSDAKGRALDQKLVEQQKDTDKFVLDLQSNVRGAGKQANELIRTWCDVQLNEHRSWLQTILDSFQDWASQAKAESEAWESAKNKGTRDAMVGDMNFLSGVVITAGDQLSEQSRQQLDKLSAEQRAIVTTYYGLGPDGQPSGNPKDAKNPIAAITAGIRARILQERTGSIRDQFDQELDKTPDKDWDKLNVLGKAENAGFDAAYVAKEIYQALHGGLVGWNDEPRVFRALGGTTKVQAMAVRRLYRLPPSAGGHGKDLDEDIKSELGGEEKKRAQALLAGDQTAADVATLREAMHGGITGWGTDEKAIMDTLRNKSPEERQKIKDLYFEKYGVKLDDDIKDELTGIFEDPHDYQRANALMQGDTAKADAIAIDQAMYGGFTASEFGKNLVRGFTIVETEPGWGTDRKSIEGVYEQVRADTEKQMQEEAKKSGHQLTTKELEEEVKRRYAQIEASYNVTYEGKWGKGDESALRRAYKDEMSEGELSLVNAIADNDLTKADAARIQIEKESVVYADDQIINGVLKHQYERALEEVKRDRGPDLYKAMEEDQRKAKPPWDAYRIKIEQRKVEAQLENEAKAKSKGYMHALENTYDTDFGKIGKGSLKLVIEQNMSGYEQQEARKRVAQGGWLTPAQEIHFATEGLGTKEDALSKALEGKTPDEITKIKEEWAKLHPGETLEQRIDSETSGRLQFELQQKLKGIPTNPDEEMERMRELAKHEEEHGLVHIGVGDETERLKFRLAEMEKKYAALKEPNLSDDERAKRIGEFQRFSGYTNTSVEEHKEKQETMTNSVVTAVTTAIAVVVAAVCIIFSGGTATPGVMAAFAAWAGSAGGAAAIAGGTALLGVGIKAVMLGSDYGVEDMGVDLAVGGVEAVAAAATAGLSKAVMSSAAERFAESMAKNVAKAEREAFKRALITMLEKDPELARRGLLGTMAQSKSLGTRMIAHGVSGAMFGGAGGLTSGAARSILDSKTWEGGGAWEKVLSAGGQSAISGTITGLGMGAVGGIRSPHAGGLPLPGEKEPAIRLPNEYEMPPAGGKHTPESLQKGLPPEMQKKVPIHLDPELEGRTVRVHYDVDETGVVKDIHIRAGPTATPRDIELHVNTVKAMQKYAGLQGKVRALLRRARAWVSRNGPPAPKTKAWEAQLEVEKLPGVIEDRLNKLADPELDPNTRLELEAEVDHLQSQFAEHSETLAKAMPDEEGRGFVAAEGREKKAPVIEEDLGAKPLKPGEEEGAAAVKKAPQTVTTEPEVKAVKPAVEGEPVLQKRTTTPEATVQEPEVKGPSVKDWEALRQEEIPLQESVAKARKDVGDAEQTIEQKQKQIEKLKKDIESATKSQQDKKAAKLQTRLKQAESDLEGLRQRKELAAKKLEGLKSTEERLQEIQQQKEKYSRAVREEERALTAKLAEDESDSSELQIQRREAEFLENEQRELASKTPRTSEEDEELRDLKFRLREAKAAVERLSASEPARTARIQSAKDRLAELKAIKESSKGWKPWRDYEYQDLGSKTSKPCFAPGTLVQTPSGPRSIETLAPGDLVLVWDFRQQAAAGRPVSRVMRNYSAHLQEIHVGNEKIVATRLHPFWEVRSAQWLEARKLWEGDRLLGMTGDALLVGHTEYAYQDCPTFNLEVHEIHNFFVGAAGVLVHNGDPGVATGEAYTSKFTKTTRKPTRIYLVERKNPATGVWEPFYVGKTFQGEEGDVITRFKDHLAEKGEWQDAYAKEELRSTMIEGAEGKWTEFETAVWEEHYIRYYGMKKESPGNPLVNARHELTEETFKEYQEGYGHNPCAGL